MFRQYIDLGGPLMWPLLICSIVLGAILLERTVVIGLRYKLMGRRLPRTTLEWHRRALPFFSDVPPAIGLLGTVQGVVTSFNLLEGGIDVDSVGVGLGIACLTTLFGLGIAIAASLAGYMLDWAVGAPAMAHPEPGP